MSEPRVTQTHRGKPIYVNMPLAGIRGAPLVTDYFGPRFNDKGHRLRFSEQTRCQGRVWRVLVSGDEWAIGEGMSMIHGELSWAVVTGEDIGDPVDLVAITIYERHDNYARAKVDLGWASRNEDLTPRLRALFDRILGGYFLHEDQTEVTYCVRDNATGSFQEVRWVPDRPMIVR